MSIPDDFNWKIYLKLNNDLNKACDENEAIYHYLNYGIYENRQYKQTIPYDFNWKIYLKLNNDLNQACDENEAIYHYLNYGIYENRQYNYNFYNIEPYKNCCDISMFQSNIDSINYCKNSFINECEIKQDLPRYYHNSKEKINFNFINTFILIIDFSNIGGGTGFFIESIITKYKTHQTFLIARNFNDQIYFTVNDEYELINSCTNNDAFIFLSNNKNKIEKIFVNHILNHSIEFLNNLFNLSVEITTITHDLILLFNNPQIFFNEIDNYVNDKTLRHEININKFDKIITQNKANLFIYNNFIEDKNKIIVTPLPDFKKSNELINTSNTDIVIGVFGIIHEMKGSEILIKLQKFYRNTNIKIIIFGLICNEITENCYPYNNINEFNELLIIHKPNILIELTLWPETYSYTLTLAMITQLPILYLKKNGMSVVEERLINYDKAYSFTNIYDFDKLIHDKKQDYFYTIEPIIYFNEFWDNYFITKKEKKFFLKKKRKNDILPYVIYFPQFHDVTENNISFYPGFSDIKNLELLSKSNIRAKIEQPSLKEFQLTNITDYDYINNKSILQKQIDIINHYNISGFAIYYYWFSINTITNKNLIMENVINQFFDNSINMKNRKCFFLWANESWTKNPAFGETNHVIDTDYTNIENYEKISENLLIYFKNINYLKIDNKPVFELHHPWFMTNEQIDILYNTLNYKCIQNNFDGIHFIVNSINGNYKNYINRCHHFNYKKTNACYYHSKLQQKILDYKSYIENDIKLNNTNELETLVFDFDNRARLFKPDKLDYSTVCVNNSEINNIIFMKKIINKYIKDKKSNIENILLINSFNEWGEKMSIEPSDEYGYYYLNLLNENLLNENLEINKYPILFDKYINNFSYINDNIDIKAVNKYDLYGNIITHIHCFDLNMFEEYFISYLDKLPKSIIVTYSNNDDNNNIIYKYSNIAQFLKIKNKGMDIGGKICCLKYLYEKEYNFEYILFIHSKSNNLSRHKYIEPLISINFQEILSNKNILGIFPNLLIENVNYFFFGTQDYRREILDYLKCKNNNNIFVEGNCLLLKKNVIDFIFYDNLNVFYNILNDVDSFDINWFKKYYFCNDNTITNEDAYNLYKKYHYKYGNMFQISNNDREMRDCMVEHVFERIWINVILHLNGEYYIK